MTAARPNRLFNPTTSRCFDAASDHGLFNNEQFWSKRDLGFGTPLRTITVGIFEPGLPDILQQMLAAFLADRAWRLGTRFGCATPDEADAHHEIRAAAVASQAGRCVIEL